MKLFCLIVGLREFEVISRDILSLSSLSDDKNKTRWPAAGMSKEVGCRDVEGMRDTVNDRKFFSHTIAISCKNIQAFSCISDTHQNQPLENSCSAIYITALLHLCLPSVLVFRVFLSCPLDTQKFLISPCPNYNSVPSYILTNPTLLFIKYERHGYCELGTDLGSWDPLVSRTKISALEKFTFQQRQTENKHIAS